MSKIQVNKNIDKRIRQGYPWIFSNEIQKTIDCEPGEVVEVISENGKSYGYGFYNKNSLIAIRLLFTDNKPNKDFYLTKILKAIDYRKRIFPDCEALRIIYGESDFLPGLIVDKFNDYLSLQFLSAGIDRQKQFIIESLISAFPSIKGIYEKNLSHLRNLEGLEQSEGVLFGNIPEEIFIIENSIQYSISFFDSQKTGYFFDQRLNRAYIQNIAKNKRVLDCYCNQGGFALNSAFAKASYVIGIDSSSSAINKAIRNARINNFGSIDFNIADVEEYLNSSIKNGRKWDIIILDPPAFAKSKKNVSSALKKYRRINSLAIQLLNNGGFLASSSCSQHIFEDVFYRIICEEVAKSNKIARLIFRGQQSPDHPILVSMPETKYLKFFIFEIINS